MHRIRFTPLQFGNRTALIRIDGVTHAIFGELALANQTNATTAYLTPTRTSFTFQIGPVDLILTFFSPIEVRLSAHDMYAHLTSRTTIIT
jgi:hypothetical protein